MKEKKKNWFQIVFSFAEKCKGKMIVSVLSAIISVGGGILPYLGVYRIISNFFLGSATKENVLSGVLMCIFGYFIKTLFYGISTTLSHISAYTILEEIRLLLAEKLMKAPLGTVMNETVGKLKSVFIDRVETIELPLAHMIPEGISNLLLPISVFVYLVSINYKMALAAMISIPLAVFVYGIMMRDFSKRYEKYMASSDHVNSVIVEYVEGIEVIKAFNQSGSSYEKFAKAVQSFKEYTLDWFQSTWKLMNLGGAILPSTLLGTLPIGLYLYLQGNLTPADYVMCLILSMGIVGPLTSFTVFINDLKMIEFAVRAAGEYLDMEELTQTYVKAKVDHYNIDLNKVSFKYKIGSKMVLNNINLHANESTFTAIVGPSGGGKSTIAKLIARFWDVSEGSILIGGVNIKNIPLPQLADMISFVTQDNFLFDCSLLENIRLGNTKATDEEVKIAAKKACCDEFITKLKKGYDTDAGTGGTKLSGGEKQRIAIARAILKNAPIVILDEATAFTDPENEDKLQESISELTKGKTLIVIAHRLSTIKNADNIIVMQEGNIQASGTHLQLLSNSLLYKHMWDAHVGAKSWIAGKMKERGVMEHV